MRVRVRRGARFALFFVLSLLVVTIVPAFFSGGRALAQEGPIAPELEPSLGWLGTDRPLRFSGELKGHVVLLDFWTHCCINCVHVVPDLAFLERKYAEEPFVVVGVHSAKFEDEGNLESVRHAMDRLGIRHPVVVDDDRAIWRTYGVRSWPSFVLVGSDGRVIGIASGEGQRGLLDGAIRDALEAGRENGTLAGERVRIAENADGLLATGARDASAGALRDAGPALRYPGKVLAIPPRGEDDRGWLAIADSGAHRVLLASYPDGEGRSEIVRVVGTGEAGLADGLEAQFREPQGMAHDAARGLIYVADRGNHAVRAIDLATFRVSTIAGTGDRGYDRRGGRARAEQPLASPWDVEVSRDGSRLFVAMAGTHQIWEIDLRTNVAGFLAGSGIENIMDGPAEDAQLAQPSAISLSGDGRTLYVADSETSAIRALELGRTRATGRVRTLIGAGLFDFGDIDGMYPDARLQHPLGVTLWSVEGEDRLLIADTYNSRIKVLNPRARIVGRWLGEGSVGGDAAVDLALAEPGGLDVAVERDGTARLFIADTNNHRVVMVDVPSRAWREVRLERRTGE